MTAQQWAFATYHLEKDREEEAGRVAEREKYHAYLRNLSLLAPSGLAAHLVGDDLRVDLPEEDAVFQRQVTMSEAAKRFFGVDQGDPGPPSLAPSLEGPHVKP